jgi:phosphohistidine phosphatase
MKLALVRHADAGDADEWAQTGQPDALRPLSEKGREQMRAVVDGLLKLVPKCRLIVSSPYTRAVQTAEFLRDAYECELQTASALEPAAVPPDFETWLHESGSADVVIAVGHEPNLGMLATWLMTGGSVSRVDFKKGGACLLAFDGPAEKGKGVLQRLLGPKELAACAARSS